jgi:hypothetical protein
MPCSLVSAPPTLNTMTATHAIQPIFIINESVYNVKLLFKYSVYSIVIYFSMMDFIGIHHLKEF